MIYAEDIIIKPLMTEKSVALQDNEKKYSFQVAVDANKIQIKHAIEELFNVKVAAVNVQRCSGRYISRRIRRSRIEGKTANWKKAIVTLIEGKTANWKKAIVTLREGDIDFFKDVM